MWFIYCIWSRLLILHRASVGKLLCIRELEKASDEWGENDVTDSFTTMKSGNESMNRDYKQLADGPPPINTHLIRQKKDFSCAQSDGDDSETGNQIFKFKSSSIPAGASGGSAPAGFE